MPKKPILLISKPIGTKGEKPVCGFPSRLVDPETRLPIEGIGDIKLNIPLKGVLTCTAEIVLGGIEVVEEDCPLVATIETNDHGRAAAPVDSFKVEPSENVESPNAGS